MRKGCYNLRSRNVPKNLGSAALPMDVDAVNDEDVVMAEIVPCNSEVQSFNIPNIRYALPTVDEVIREVYSSTALSTQAQHDCAFTNLEGLDIQCFKCFSKGMPDIIVNWQYQTPQQQYAETVGRRGDIIPYHVREEVKSAPTPMILIDLDEDDPFEEFINQANESLAKGGRGY